MDHIGTQISDSRGETSHDCRPGEGPLVSCSTISRGLKARMKEFATRGEDKAMRVKMSGALAMLIVLLCGSAFGRGRKPVVYIRGRGNISINSEDIGAATIGPDGAVSASSSASTINKHNQTMEMAQDFMHYCPSVALTLNAKAPADYTVILNREGQPTIIGELGRSQIMVLNSAGSPIYVGKKAPSKTPSGGPVTKFSLIGCRTVGPFQGPMWILLWRHRQ